MTLTFYEIINWVLIICLASYYSVTLAWQPVCKRFFQFLIFPYYNLFCQITIYFQSEWKIALFAAIKTSRFSQVHNILAEMVMGGMVLETNMNEIITQVDAQNKMEKSEVSLTCLSTVCMTEVSCTVCRHACMLHPACFSPVIWWMLPT